MYQSKSWHVDQPERRPPRGRRQSTESPRSPVRVRCARPLPLSGSTTTPSGWRKPHAANGRCGTASCAACSAQWWDASGNTREKSSAKRSSPTRGAAIVHVVSGRSAGCTLAKSSAASMASEPPIEWPVSTSAGRGGRPSPPLAACSVASLWSSASTAASSRGRSERYASTKPRCSVSSVGSPAPRAYAAVVPSSLPYVTSVSTFLPVHEPRNATKIVRASRTSSACVSCAAQPTWATTRSFPSGPPCSAASRVRSSPIRTSCSRSPSISAEW
mmetsp:Transcript_36493/g.91184  ORF Transcript_36493/g.91184 Transcript_36493/m.91184 type:complete len:273 (+) Transcript_36493:418-1236(+)